MFGVLSAEGKGGMVMLWELVGSSQEKLKNVFTSVTLCMCSKI